LNDEIIVKRSTAEVFGFCIAHASEFDAVNVVTVMQRIVKFADADEAAPRAIEDFIAVLFPGDCPRIAEIDFRPLHLSSIAWSLARCHYVDQPLLAAISSASIRRIAAFTLQTLASMAWAFSTLSVLDLPLCDAIAASSIPRIQEFSPHDIATTLWSCAKLLVHNTPLRESLSSASGPTLGHLEAHHIAVTAWSVSAF
jgi:hypothetical protein